MVPAWGGSTNGIALHPSATARSRRENLATSRHIRTDLILDERLGNFA
jgi:hypothetical protein